MGIHREILAPTQYPGRARWNYLPLWARRTVTVGTTGLLALALSGCETGQGCAVSFAGGTEYSFDDPGNQTLQQAIDKVDGIDQGNCRETVEELVDRQLRANKDTVKLPGSVSAD
jgi:hypothetical protein